MLTNIHKNSSAIEISGSIDFKTTPKLVKAGYKLILQEQSLLFDLQNAYITDISGLALLLSWTRHANKLGKTISFINVPNKLKDMAKLSGLHEILPIK